jgi:hypothetical protein
MGIILIPVRPLARVVMKIVHCASVIQADKQIVQLFRENIHRDVTVVQQRTRRLVIVYLIYHQPSMASGKDYQKIEGSVKPIRGTQCMKSGFNRGVRSVNAD